MYYAMSLKYFSPRLINLQATNINENKNKLVLLFTTKENCTIGIPSV